MGDIFWGALPKKEILFLGGGVRNMLRRPGAVTQLLHTAQGSGVIMTLTKSVHFLNNLYNKLHPPVR